MTQPAEQSETRSLTGIVRWLEDEQRQAKGQYNKLQQLLDQLQAQVWDQGERLRSTEDLSSASNGHLSRITRLEDEARLLHDFATRLENMLTDVSEKNAEIQRLLQLELDRERQERGDIHKKMDCLADSLEKMNGRVQALDEALRRQQEPVIKLQQNVSDLMQQGESAEARIGQSGEQHKRWGNEISRISREIESVHEQNAVILERLRLLAEQPKRLEEQMAAVLAEEAARRSLEQGLDLEKAERDRLERNLGEMEQTVGQHGELLEQNARFMTHLETKGKGMDDRVSELREQFWILRQQVQERLSQLSELEEEQKRRQIADLEQQIREIKHWLARPPEN